MYVARVAAFRDGVYSNVDWLFDKVAVLHRAVCIATVGRNGGGHVTPRAEHYPALDQINSMLASGAYTLGVLDREGGMSMQYEAEHLLPQLVTCETTARSIPATALAMYSQAKRTKGASKWSAPLLIGDDVRMTQGHSRATVICHWAVRRSKSKVSHPPPPSTSNYHFFRTGEQEQQPSAALHDPHGPQKKVHVYIKLFVCVHNTP